MPQISSSWLFLEKVVKCPASSCLTMHPGLDTKKNRKIDPTSNLLSVFIGHKLTCFFKFCEIKLSVYLNQSREEGEIIDCCSNIGFHFSHQAFWKLSPNKQIHYQCLSFTLKVQMQKLILSKQLFPDRFYLSRNDNRKSFRVGTTNRRWIGLKG